MSNQRLLAMSFIVLTGSLAYVLERVSDALLGFAGVGNFEVFGGVGLSWALGLGIAFTVALVAWFNPKVQEAGQDVAAELRKVTWPTRNEIRAATFAVVLFSLIASALFGVMDFVSAKVMGEWIPAGIRWAQGIL